MHTLYWHSDDLRLQDNPALHAAVEGSSTLICLYVLDKNQTSDEFGNQRTGAHRREFVWDSLQVLQQDYEKLNQRLHIATGDPIAIIAALLATGAFDRIVQSRQHAFEERLRWQALARANPGVEFVEVDTSTLYKMEQVALEAYPDTFSKFRRNMERLKFRPEAPATDRLPPAGRLPVDLLGKIGVQENTQTTSSKYPAGYEKLNQYFATRAASSYKQTRNQFMGEDFSTGLSPWLSHGCFSPRQVITKLTAYEAEHGANDSTQWIVFELLWREYFRWYGAAHGSKLFAYSGIGSANRIPASDSAAIEQWRTGAGYFEQQLIDYDPCSNWGNWQYIAGVGADPRGGRHFNLAKQVRSGIQMAITSASG